MNRIRYTVALVVVLCSVAIYSCIKDACAGKVCNNGGVCVDAVCSCPDGFEGERCDAKWSDKFSGKWQMTDKFNFDTVSRTSTINVSGMIDPDTFMIYQFADTINVRCTKTSHKVFRIIEDQKIDSFLTIKSGNGTINTSTQTVTGLYSFQLKRIINDTTTSDTLITSKFTWTK
jgi:hypothetical protein